MSIQITAAVFLCMILNVGLTAEPSEEQLREGIWKSPPPPEKSKAEFGAQDPYGLAFGDHIVVDCSIYWVSTETGKLYCFNSLTSKAYFLDNPDGYIKRAQRFTASEEQDRGEGAMDSRVD